MSKYYIRNACVFANSLQKMCQSLKKTEKCERAKGKFAGHSVNSFRKKISMKVCNKFKYRPYY